MYNLWDQDRENIELFLRLFSECWYLLCEWEVEEGTKGLSWDAFRDTLIECTTYGLEHFNQDIRFLWIGGYMISMFPYLLAFITLWNDRTNSNITDENVDWVLE